MIGLRYRLGGDGSDGSIDCIHVVIAVEQQLGIAMPPVRDAWYEGNRWAIYRDLLRWGRAINEPTYDGDMIVFPGDDWAFGVVWQSGLLMINRKTERVQWFPLSAAQSLTGCRCFRSKER